MPGKTTAAAKQITLPVVTQEQLKRHSEYVRREAAAGEVRGVLNIGHYLFGQLFGASEEAFRSKNPNKQDSLADLAAQDGMEEAGWKRTRLHNAIELALMAKAHNDFRAWRFLRPSHYEVVIGMPTDRQRELLDQADKEHWSVKTLGKAAGKKKAPKAKAGPTAMSPKKAKGELRKVQEEIARLAAKGTSVDAFLVPAGIDAKRVAKFTALMEAGLAMLQGFQKELEQMK